MKRFWSVYVWTGPDGNRVLRMRMTALAAEPDEAKDTIEGMFPMDFFNSMETLFIVRPISEESVCNAQQAAKQKAAMQALCQQAQENTNTLNNALHHHQRGFRRQSL